MPRSGRNGTLDVELFVPVTVIDEFGADEFSGSLVIVVLLLLVVEGEVATFCHNPRKPDDGGPSNLDMLILAGFPSMSRTLVALTFIAAAALSA